MFGDALLAFAGRFVGFVGFVGEGGGLGRGAGCLGLLAAVGEEVVGAEGPWWSCRGVSL